MPPHPTIAPEPISVRQASIFPMASLTAMDGGNADFAGAKIGLILPHDEHPCLRLALPLAGCAEDSHLRIINPTPQ